MLAPRTTVSHSEVVFQSAMVYLVYLKPLEPRKLLVWVWVSAASLAKAPKAVFAGSKGGTTTVTLVVCRSFTVQS